MSVKFGALEQTQGLHLHGKFHLNVFIVSASGGQKTQFGQILIFGGSCTDPFTDEGEIWCAIADHGVRLRAKFCLDRFILSNSVGKKTIFAFFGLRHLVVSPVGSSLRNLDTGAQQLAFSHPTASKLFLYSNAFMAKSGAQSMTFKIVTDKQTN